mgnify:CR=1 FL=1
MMNSKMTAIALATVLALNVTSAQAQDTSQGEVAVFLTITTQPGQREVLVDLWDAHLRDRAAEDDSHVSYVFALDMMDPNMVHITEVYATQAAFEANSQSPWFAAYMEEVGPLLAGEPAFAMATPHWVK